MNNLKKYILSGLLLFCCCLLYIDCNIDTFGKYFDIAVLNTNILNGFANDGLLRQLESPSVKISENNGESVPMKRSEIINTKIQLIETNHEKLENLKATEDTKDMLTSSLALYKYILPVYKKEYVQLAELYDNRAPKEQIQSLSKSIHDKYSAGYTELYNKLIDIGKIYAEKHAIKVNWGVY